MTASARLVLWDVDGTLLSVAGVSRDLYAVAFAAVTGRPLGPLADMRGRTERAIALDTLSMNGVGDPHAAVAALEAALCLAAPGLEPRMRREGRPLRGAGTAIAALAGDGIRQSLVTGNLREVAAVKLRAFDLVEHVDLDVGGYGDDGVDRSELVRQARRRAEAKFATSFAGHRSVVIGDTEHDVTGAHGAGAWAVGVATGTSTAAQLATAGADVVLPDLTDVDALRRAVSAAP